MPRSIIGEGRLVYGMQLPIQSQSTNYVQPWETHAGPADLAEIVQTAERAGFSYVAVCDHVAVPAGPADTMGTTWYDTIATLGWIAGMTSRMHLLSHVYVPAYRHPLQVAKSWLTLDALSGGRAILGVGVGHVEGEFEALGVDYHARGRITDDALEVIRTAFLTEWPDVDNDTYQVRGVGVSPRPARDGGPPIWIGGSSPAALRRVARFGDGWLPQGTPYDEMPASIEFIRKERKQYHGDEPFDVGIITSFLYLGEPDFDVPAGSFTGPPERIARGMRKLGQLGANQLQVRFAARSAAEYCDQVGRFGAEVGPALID